MTLDALDLDSFDHATAVFAQVLRSMDRADGDRRTACGGWTITEVANHVCGGALRYIHYLRGGAPEDISWTHNADNIGDDPRAVHRRLSADLRTLFAHPDAGSLRARHPMRTVSGAQLLRMRVLELAVHAWDISSTLDGAATIDDDLATYLLDRAAELLEAERAHGYFTDVQPVGPDGSASARLLALTGRRAAATPSN